MESRLTPPDFSIPLSLSGYFLAGKLVIRGERLLRNGLVYRPSSSSLISPFPPIGISHKGVPPVGLDGFRTNYIAFPDHPISYFLSSSLRNVRPLRLITTTAIPPYFMRLEFFHGFLFSRLFPYPLLVSTPPTY